MDNGEIDIDEEVIVLAVPVINNKRKRVIEDDDEDCIPIPRRQQKRRRTQKSYKNPYDDPQNLYKKIYNEKNVKHICDKYPTREDRAMLKVLAFDSKDLRTTAYLIKIGIKQSNIILIERDMEIYQDHLFNGFYAIQGDTTKDTAAIIAHLKTFGEDFRFDILTLDMNGGPKTNFRFLRELIKHNLINTDKSIITITYTRRLRNPKRKENTVKRIVHMQEIHVNRALEMFGNKKIKSIEEPYEYGNPRFGQANMESRFYIIE